MVYDFCTSRGGLHAREFARSVKGQYGLRRLCGPRDLFRNGVTGESAVLHMPGKFFELHEAGKSTLAATALEFIQKIYEVMAIRDASPAERLCRPVSRPAVCRWTPGMNG